MALLTAGCDPPALTDNGVIGAFGRQGLGPGDFSYPRAVAAAPDGSIFVVDKSARIQRFSAEGVFQTSWRTPEKQAGKPIGLTVHPDGRVFVADTHYHRVLVYDRDGQLLDTFGKPGRGDGEFELPTDVAIDADGFIYVGEYYGNDRITKWSPSLQFVRAIGEDPIDGVRLSRPAGIDIDDEQTLWVADACNHRVVRFDLDGKVLSFFGTMGSEPGQLRYPYDLTVTAQNTIMVCEYENNRLQWFDKQGHSLGVWGSPGRDLGQLASPWGVAIGCDGLIYVVDSLNSRVQIVSKRSVNPWCKGKRQEATRCLLPSPQRGRWNIAQGERSEPWGKATTSNKPPAGAREIMRYCSDSNDATIPRRSVAPVGGSNDDARRTQGSLRSPWAIFRRPLWGLSKEDAGEGIGAPFHILSLLPCCLVASLPRCLVALLPCCLVASLPCCLVASLPRCLVALLPRCLVALLPLASCLLPLAFTPLVR